MSLIGKLLVNRRAGEQTLAWYRSNLAAAATFDLTSPDFDHETTLPVRHVVKRLGGQNLSPALAWALPPAETAQLLLVVEDPDVPLRSPLVHAAALLDPAVTELPCNALDSSTPAAGMQILRSSQGRGYHGPAPIKGHGPHRYAFQLFALAEPISTAAGKPVASAKPKAVLEAGQALARARIDGLYDRP
jgi:hypothetical protein